MAKKSAVRTLVVLTCTECKKYSYNTEKNRRNTPDRIELSKYCRTCRTRSTFRERR
ncbi:MAG: 50S ribosomal protein L33 [SAR202 cluster bacterium]|uniref:50S ribosomal protein L33 n=1 Tax=marine metagenome TaxID=408172 RepID=A0A382R7E1_9ZZZZ|nr:50S ribosomal protein L33 [Chloroflexota bacterium]MCL0030773.1 50S ribosomal protein L33 [Dehalococcoidia bacterium]MDP6425607.1 50S ribosomal protein L33 [Dehalococcoidia bacterium]MDP7232183.1 50S ribosomal protein L33 [Dehalococcoidia bacterium]MQG46801.1 50S ribosomal protein L33 [SAR202 cluster bacterium]